MDKNYLQGLKNLKKTISNVLEVITFDCEDLKTVIFEKFTDEEVQCLAKMEKDDLYATIQNLHNQNINPIIDQLPTSHNEVKRILFFLFTLFLNYSPVIS